MAYRFVKLHSFPQVFVQILFLNYKDKKIKNEAERNKA